MSNLGGFNRGRGPGASRGRGGGGQSRGGNSVNAPEDGSNLHMGRMRTAALNGPPTVLPTPTLPLENKVRRDIKGLTRGGRHGGRGRGSSNAFNENGRGGGSSLSGRWNEHVNGLPPKPPQSHYHPNNHSSGSTSSLNPSQHPPCMPTSASRGQSEKIFRLQNDHRSIDIGNNVRDQQNGNWRDPLDSRISNDEDSGKENGREPSLIQYDETSSSIGRLPPRPSSTYRVERETVASRHLQPPPMPPAIPPPPYPASFKPRQPPPRQIQSQSSKLTASPLRPQPKQISQSYIGIPRREPRESKSAEGPLGEVAVRPSSTKRTQRVGGKGAIDERREELFSLESLTADLHDGNEEGDVPVDTKHEILFMEQRPTPVSDSAAASLPSPKSILKSISDPSKSIAKPTPKSIRPVDLGEQEDVKPNIHRSPSPPCQFQTEPSPFLDRVLYIRKNDTPLACWGGGPGSISARKIFQAKIRKEIIQKGGIVGKVQWRDDGLGVDWRASPLASNLNPNSSTSTAPTKNDKGKRRIAVEFVNSPISQSVGFSASDNAPSISSTSRGARSSLIEEEESIENTHAVKAELYPRPSQPTQSNNTRKRKNSIAEVLRTERYQSNQLAADAKTNTNEPKRESRSAWKKRNKGAQLLESLQMEMTEMNSEGEYDALLYPKIKELTTSPANDNKEISNPIPVTSKATFTTSEPSSVIVDEKQLSNPNPSSTLLQPCSSFDISSDTTITRFETRSLTDHDPNPFRPSFQPSFSVGPIKDLYNLSSLISPAVETPAEGQSYLDALNKKMSSKLVAIDSWTDMLETAEGWELELVQRQVDKTQNEIFRLKNEIQSEKRRLGLK